jgi:hypothetical protein
MIPALIVIGAAVVVGWGAMLLFGLGAMAVVGVWGHGCYWRWCVCVRR